MKKEVNCIENQGENWYKMLLNCQLTDLGEKSRSTLGPIISGTKYHRNKLIPSTERGDQ